MNYISSQEASQRENIMFRPQLYIHGYTYRNLRLCTAGKKIWVKQLQASNSKLQNTW